MKRSGYLAIILGGILFGSQVLLPSLAEMMITRSLERSISASEMSVDVDAFPALSILQGSADEIELTGRDVLVGKLLCSEATATFTDVRIDTARLMNDGTFVFEHLGEVSASIEIKEEELAKTLEQSVEKLSNVTVHITPSGVEAEGDYMLGKLPVRISLTGQLVGRGNKIYFVSERAALKHAIGKISANVKTDVELAELSSLPFAVRVTNVSKFDGKVSVRVEKEDTSTKQKTK
jgi:hypothetical protein